MACAYQLVLLQLILYLPPSEPASLALLAATAASPQIHARNVQTQLSYI